jgi:hypothetical protein
MSKFLTPMQTELTARKLISPNSYLWLRGPEYTSWNTMVSKGYVTVPHGKSWLEGEISEDGKARFFAGKPKAFWVLADGSCAVFDRGRFFVELNSPVKADRIVAGLMALPEKITA